MDDASSRPTDVAPRSELPSATEWGSPVVEPRPTPAMTRYFRQRTGVVPRLLPYVCPHPWVHRPLLYLLVPDLRHTDPDLCHQICFVIARDNSCRYCYGSLRTFLRVSGYSESDLDQLETKLYLSSPQGKEREALQFALRLSRGQVPDDALDTLRDAGYDDPAIREIIGSAVLVTITNRVATMLAAPIDEDLEATTDPWYFPAVRPVVASVVDGMQHFQPPVHAPIQSPVDAAGDAGQQNGLVSEAVARLRGTVAGRVVQIATRRWLRRGGDGLPLRTKLLMLAVVAHGLSCEGLKARIRETLVGDEQVSESAFTAAVEHLRGEDLSSQESDLLSLARASIRYTARDIQQSVRETTQSLSRLQTIDTVATLGLSNALARLHALPA